MNVTKQFKTAELCFEAVNSFGWAFKYVPDELKTAELCLTAVKNDGWTLKLLIVLETVDGFTPASLAMSSRVKSTLNRNTDQIDKLPGIMCSESGKRGFFGAFKNHYLKNTLLGEIGNKDGNVVILPEPGKAAGVIGRNRRASFVIHRRQIDPAGFINRKSVEQGMKPFKTEAGVLEVAGIRA